jgi:hypothetical protein
MWRTPPARSLSKMIVSPGAQTAFAKVASFPIGISWIPAWSM